MDFDFSEETRSTLLFLKKVTDYQSPEIIVAKIFEIPETSEVHGEGLLVGDTYYAGISTPNTFVLLRCNYNKKFPELTSCLAHIELGEFAGVDRRFGFDGLGKRMIIADENELVLISTDDTQKREHVELGGIPARLSIYPIVGKYAFALWYYPKIDGQPPIKQNILYWNAGKLKRINDIPEYVVFPKTGKYGIDVYGAISEVGGNLCFNWSISGSSGSYRQVGNSFVLNEKSLCHNTNQFIVQ